MKFEDRLYLFPALFLVWAVAQWLGAGDIEPSFWVVATWINLAIAIACAFAMLDLLLLMRRLGRLLSRADVLSVVYHPGRYVMVDRIVDCAFLCVVAGAGCMAMNHDRPVPFSSMAGFFAVVSVFHALPYVLKVAWYPFALRKMVRRAYHHASETHVQ